MGKQKDDFAWLVASLNRHKKSSPPVKSQFAERRFESVDEIVERRTRRKDRQARILMLLLEMLPFVFMLLIVLMH